ncbi:MAG: sigma-70 family RNA polymerase sigma factor [Acidobacteria bacterium]|nr:sigma-70 family RNA polymerase sigma factor [Acidobacteriota bacterium]
MASLRLITRDDGPSDRDLIDQTLGGDQAGFALLVSKYQRRIYRMAFAIVRNEADADSITQDAFVTAYVNLAKFEGRSEFETWLTRIAINKCRDQLRGRKWKLIPIGPAAGDDEAPSLDVADERPNAEREIISAQIGQAIERAVESLSAQQKVIFRLRHFEELPLEEIATLLDLAPGTVRAHLFRAVHKVRKELEPWAAANAAAGEAE